MKKMMKLTALMLTAAMVMTGCGGGSEDAAGDAAYKVGIVQQMEHAALDAATQGFQDKLTELLGDQVAFDYQNAQGEQTNCTT
ncbi:MAG: ABC transporter substrate-binding protein, partial [Anaerotignum sp.]|nr:ABC transporter substrate-binding protein [Anaerotignum sp.]